MATLTQAPGTKQTITIGLASTPLASSATFVIGRESAQINNSTDKYVDAIVEGKITVGTPTTANTEIQVWVYASFHTSLATAGIDVLDGTDSDVTFATAGVRGTAMKMGARVDVDTTTANRTYPIAPFSVAELFGGKMPVFWGLFVAQNTGGALNSTAGNHELSFTGIKYESA